MSKSLPLIVLVFLATSITCLPLNPAPYDSDLEECVAINPQSSGSFNNTVVLLDTFNYLTLDRLWFADDEGIDLFDFPVPEDPVRWEIVDDSECSNVWQYCGNSSSDIVFSQFISRGNFTDTEMTISVDFTFFTATSQPSTRLPCSEESTETLIVEVDDTTGLENIHTEQIRCADLNIPQSSSYEFTYTPSEDFELVFRTNISNSVCVNISRVRVFHHVCPYTIVDYVEYSATTTGKEITGDCVSNAVPRAEENYFGTCGNEGTWFFNETRGCHCDRGFTNNQSDSECFQCPAGTYKFVASNEPCVECPSKSSSVAGSTYCVCDSGYARLNHTDITTPCGKCALNYYRNNGICVSCPLPGSTNFVGASNDQCRCALNGNDISTGEMETNVSIPCEFCATNYYRNSSDVDCTLCPPGSRRELVSLDTSTEAYCACINGSFTASGTTQTNYEPCDHCTSTHYFDGIECAPCPNNSFSEMPTATQCRCVANTLNPNDLGNYTNEESCVCATGFYHRDDACEQCPLNSFRRYSDAEMSCSCNNGYSRQSPADASNPCLPIVGFNTSSISLPEGDKASHNVTLSVFVPVGASETLSIPLSVSGSDDSSAVVPEEIIVGINDQQTDFELELVGNEIALEFDKLFILSLMEGAGYVIGGSVNGQSYYGNLDVVLRDDDIVSVGFGENRLDIDQSIDSINVPVIISSEISRELLVEVSIVYSTRATTENDVVVLTFEPGGPLSEDFPLDLERDTTFEDLDHNIMITLSLEVVNAVEFVDRIRVGGSFEGQTLNSQLLLVLEDPSPLLSTGAIIGIVASCLSVLIIVVSVSVVACVCCLKLRKKTKAKGQSEHRMEVRGPEMKGILEEEELDKSAL